MPDLWMPGAIQIRSPRRIALNNNGRRLLTWHTFECPYSWGVRQALQFLIDQATEAFVFHPITGEWGQCQPMNTGARTLKAQGAVTNGYGTVHQQVEVIGYAGKPFTNDLTAAGREGLARGLEFFRSWGIPDQWAWTGVTRPPATYAEMLRFPKRAPDRSGHAFHSGWHGGNLHWDPGAIAAPWSLAPPEQHPPVDNEEFDMSAEQYATLKKQQDEILNVLNHHIRGNPTKEQKENAGTSRDLPLRDLAWLTAGRVNSIRARQWDVIKATDAVVDALTGRGVSLDASDVAAVKAALAQED